VYMAEGRVIKHPGITGPPLDDPEGPGD
jgi:hypothetical protein